MPNKLLYTRCPSCKSEVQFSAPDNIEGLPETYRHHIKCPSCGVTLSVKLNTVARNYVQQPSAPVMQTINDSDYMPQQVEEQATVPVREEQNKKRSGVGRNVLMMVISLLFIALGVVGYLIGKGTISMGENAYGLQMFDGIGGFELLIKDFASFKELFELDILLGIAAVVPMALFVFAGVTFIVAFISALGKKYSRAFNVIWAILTFVLAVAIIFLSYITAKTIATDESVTLTIADYFKLYLGDGKQYAMFAPALLGLLQLIFSLIFLKSLNIKEKKK